MDRVSFVQLCLPSPRGASPASVDLCSYRKCLDCTKSMCERSQRLFVKLVDDMVGLSADCIIEPLRPVRGRSQSLWRYRFPGFRSRSYSSRPARAPAARSRARTAVIPSDVCIRASSVALSGLWLSLNLPSGSTICSRDPYSGPLHLLWLCTRRCQARVLALRVERSKAVHRRRPSCAPRLASFLDLCLARAYPALLISFLDLSLAARSERLAARPPASAWPSCALRVESAGQGSERFLPNSAPKDTSEAPIAPPPPNSPPMCEYLSSCFWSPRGM